MTTHLSWESINDFADDQLLPADHANAQAHFADCNACRSDLLALRTLLSTAQTLPHDVKPPAEVWTAIHRSINDGKSIPFPTPIVHDRGIRVSRTRLAAAAILLVTATAAVTTVVMRSPGLGGFTGDSANLAMTPIATTNASQNITATASEIVMLEAEYLATATALRATLDRTRSTLAPTTIATVERSLTIIDEAIAEARDALLQDPANTALREMLRRSHQQKIDFLRRTTTLLDQA